MIKVNVIHRNGTVRSGTATPSVRKKYSVHFGNIAGSYEFSLTHGWGERLVEDWRLTDESLAECRAQYEKDHGKVIRPMPKSPGRKRAPRRGSKADPRQIGLSEVKKP